MYVYMYDYSGQWASLHIVLRPLADSSIVHDPAVQLWKLGIGLSLDVQCIAYGTLMLHAPGEAITCIAACSAG